MSHGSTAFEEFLAADEAPVTVGSGALVEGPRRPASICLTDRRVLFVSADRGFVDVPLREVRSIRSRATTRHTDRELAALVLAVGGGAVAALAGAALALAADATAIALALVVGVGVLAAVAVGRTGVAVDGGDVEAAVDRIEAALGSVDALDRPTLARRRRARLARFVEDRPLLQWAGVIVAAVGAVGLLAVGAWAELGLALAAIVGVGAAVRGAAFLRALDQRGERVVRERAVDLHLVDGRTVRFRIDAGETVDRELSRMTASRPVGALPGEVLSRDAVAEAGTSERV